MTGELDDPIAADRSCFDAALGELTRTRLVSLAPGQAGSASTGLRDEPRRRLLSMLDRSFQAGSPFGERPA